MNAPSPITTHVLDTRTGQPARGMAVTLERRDERGTWERIADGATNDDGRITDLLPPGELPSGVYRLNFETAAYFASQAIAGFYPQVSIAFEVTDGAQHHHVPLLLSPFGYSTYRGS